MHCQWSKPEWKPQLKVFIEISNFPESIVTEKHHISQQKNTKGCHDCNSHIDKLPNFWGVVQHKWLHWSVGFPSCASNAAGGFSALKVTPAHVQLAPGLPLPCHQGDKQIRGFTSWALSCRLLYHPLIGITGPVKKKWARACVDL